MIAVIRALAKQNPPNPKSEAMANRHLEKPNDQHRDLVEALAVAAGKAAVVLQRRSPAEERPLGVLHCWVDCSVSCDTSPIG